MSGLVDRIRGLTRRARSLAVARYVHDNPDARSRVNPVWVDDDVQAWAVRSPEEIAVEAQSRLNALDAWEADARVEPDILETRRIDLLHARLALAAAKTGSFATASGALADFLREAGSEPDILDVH